MWDLPYNWKYTKNLYKRHKYEYFEIRIECMFDVLVMLML